MAKKSIQPRAAHRPSPLARKARWVLWVAWLGWFAGAPEVLAQVTAPASGVEEAEEAENGEDLIDLFDHKNWYTLEMIVFSRPLEDASVTPTDNPQLEQLQLRQRIKLPASLKTLVQGPQQPEAPNHIGLLNALLNSYKYHALAEAVDPGAAPELEDLLLWLDQIKSTHTPQTLPQALEQLKTAGQYWPYIKPLFPNQPEFLIPTTSQQQLAVPAETAEFEEAVSITIPNDLAYRKSSHLRLSKEARKIAADSRYQILWHQAWHQPLSPRDKGMPILIQGVHSSTAGTDLPFLSLDGLLTVELSRFIHARIQLWAKPPELVQSKRVPEGFIEFDTKVRLRSHEYHYLDHPYLGVMLLIVPLEPKPDRFSPQHYSF